MCLGSQREAKTRKREEHNDIEQDVPSSRLGERGFVGFLDLRIVQSIQRHLGVSGCGSISRIVAGLKGAGGEVLWSELVVAIEAVRLVGAARRAWQAWRASDRQGQGR